MVPRSKIRTHSSHRATLIVSGVTGDTPMAVLMSIAATDLSKPGATVPSESAAMERIPSHKSNAANNKRQYESSRPLAHSKVMRVEAVNPGRRLAATGRFYKRRLAARSVYLVLIPNDNRQKQIN